ncbi:metallo-beta-lactamase superfamily protein [Lysobacter gummosus]|nr:metallo-beta-lactamase superfamily protein [Lysobacter gummosus]
MTDSVRLFFISASEATMRLAMALIGVLALGGCAAPALKSGQKAATAAAACPADPTWDTPSAPHHIHGNTWFVGTCGISSILITSDQGHVLIDGTTKKGAASVEANIRALGFKVEDVRYILSSHEHLDHAGGIAQLQRDSGATVVALPAEAASLERGQGDRGDPQFLSTPAFAPVRTVRRIEAGETLTLRSIALTAHATPGHTPGSTSWTWRSCDQGGQCRAIAYADSLTPFSDDVYRYTDEAAHPGFIAAFRQSLVTVANLPCDILLTPHPGASELFSRLGPGATRPLVDAGACRAYSATGAAKLDARIARERGDAKP